MSAASIRGMRSHLAPVLRVVDASAAAERYARHLGFTTEFEHRFEPGLPLYVGLVRDDARIHLSEHTGDARPGTLVYLWVPDVDSVAAACGVSVIDDNPWGRDFEVTVPTLVHHLPESGLLKRAGVEGRSAWPPEA